MKITEVKTYLNKSVRFISKKLNIDNDDNDYLLTACILRQNSKGEYYYLAELTDIKQKNSVIIVNLDEIKGGTP